MYSVLRKVATDIQNTHTSTYLGSSYSHPVKLTSQNKVEELYSLFKFLNIRPLNSWETFKRQIVSPIKSGQTKVAMKRLHVVLNSVMLRRTKDATISTSTYTLGTETDSSDGKAILNLPGRTVNVVDCPFDDSERAFYQAVEKKMDAKLQKVCPDWDCGLS